MASLFGCHRPDHQESFPFVVGSDSLSFEGEFRLRDGAGEWMRCADGKRFKTVGTGVDSLIMLYTTQVGHMGDAVKVWLLGGWSADSTVVAHRLVHLAPALRCAALPNSSNSGSFVLSYGTPGRDERRAQLDLFPSGLAVQYSTFREATEREEFGSWGMDSDGLLQLTWPQRPLVLSFQVRGDSLVQHNARNVDAIATFVRTGGPERGRGTLGIVLALLSEVTSKPQRTFDAATLGTPLAALEVNDTAMMRLADLLVERHGMGPEVRERRWSSISTLQDLLELARTLER
ncbi:MAG: hypothetical protein IPJ76_03430 [Flavobacteriales bacterium]|nr:MAG: hypothetical protein IPJ76_03430 [Flavobacteriales bacterium]